MLISLRLWETIYHIASWNSHTASNEYSN